MLQGSVIATRDDANGAYRGRAGAAMAILDRQVKPPKSSSRLEKALASS